MPVTREEVQSMIVAAMNSQLSPFSLAKVPYHTHNGVDSPFSFEPTGLYVGWVISDGTFAFLPNGWSSVKLSTGAYQITHNLNSLLYAVFTNSAQDTNHVVASIIAKPTPDTFTADWFLTTTAAASDTDFYFILAKIKNTNVLPATY